MRLTRTLGVLSAAALLTCVFATTSATPAEAAGCSDWDQLHGACIGNGTVDVGGSTEVPGAGGSGGSGGGGWTPHPDWATGGDGTPGSNIGPGGETAVCSVMRPDECFIVTPPPAESVEEAAVPTVTIRDVASFAPDGPTVTSEPRVWGLRNAHTNVIANASGHTRTGTLLGQAAAVHFIPVGFVIDYGDGTTATTASGGDTWANLGLVEFSKTPTSHRYTEVGTKTITAEVEYAAEYSVNGGAWIPVAGTLSIPSDTPHTIQVVRNSTVGVDKPCTPGRVAVGC